MTFYVEGRSKHELMPLERLFKNRLIEKAHEAAASHAIDSKEFYQKYVKNSQREKLANHTYKKIQDLSQLTQVVYAEQIMTSPVVTFTPNITVDRASQLFHTHQFRHVPIISSDSRLVGIISDRDILGVIAGNGIGGVNSSIESVMKNEVLTASVKTDIRYIARLFVENRIGSMPVMNKGMLTGIITRSDILKAIFNHYKLELWI